MRALVTGGCGFIGSHVVRALVRKGWAVTNLDKLTYASNPANLGEAGTASNYRFVQGDVCDSQLVASLVAETDIVLNFAAETHVDRSLLDPGVFVRTDVEGLVCLIEAVRTHPGARLVHMSTDEVFGSLPAPIEANEDFPFAPTSPYSASKAAAELQLRAYAQSYGMSLTVIRSCNVYGPNQHIEKFIPLFATLALAEAPMPLYGDGLQEREWLYVDDLVEAVSEVIERIDDQPGLTAWHAGSGERLPNRLVAERICSLAGAPLTLIAHVEDRPGHDRRYALDCGRLRENGWLPKVPFCEGLERTVRWYAENVETWGAAATDEFSRYFASQYGKRLARAGTHPG